jgi:hypothetical protein
LSGVRNPKSLINSVSGNPHDPIRIILRNRDNRDTITVGASDFSVDEEVLELFPAPQPGWVKSVARAPVSYDQTLLTTVAPNQGRHAVSRDCTFDSVCPLDFLYRVW